MTAPRKDGSLDFCVEFQKLSGITKRKSYSAPRIDERIDFFKKAAVFFILDASSEYWQVEVEQTVRDKAAFKSHHGLYRFMRLPFGLKNVPGMFPRAMGVVCCR